MPVLDGEGGGACDYSSNMSLRDMAEQSRAEQAYSSKSFSYFKIQVIINSEPLTTASGMRF
jgi:hypothetical protein